MSSPFFNADLAGCLGLFHRSSGLFQSGQTDRPWLFHVGCQWLEDVRNTGQMLALQQPFQVEGEVSFNGRQLNNAVLAEPWRWLGDWMAEQLMGLSPLGALSIEENLIELHAVVAAHQDTARRRFRLNAEQGTLCFRPESADGPCILLPMDPAIRIEHAQLFAGQLVLKGHSTVTP